MKAQNVKALEAICNETAKGKDIFNKVILLALTARSRVNAIAAKVVDASSEAKADARANCQTVIDEFNSIKGALLESVSDKAFNAGSELRLDELCNYKA